MRLLPLLLLAAGITALSCQDNSTEYKGDPGPVETPVFAKNAFVLSAKPGNLHTDVPTTISGVCLPLFSGKGHVQILLLGGGETVQVDKPQALTLDWTQRVADIPVVYTAGSELAQEWVVRFTNPTVPVAFEGYAYMDSLLISGRYWSMDSDSAKRLVTTGNLFRSFAQSPDPLRLELPATL